MSAEKKLKKELRKYFLTVALATALVLLFAVVCVYVFRPDNYFVNKFSRVLHLPAAYVFNAGSVALVDFNERLVLAQKINGQTLQVSERSDILRQLISDKIITHLAAENNLLPNEKELSDSLAFYKNIADANEPFYGLDQKEFQRSVLIPELLSNKLAIWLSSNNKLNVSAYQKLALLQSALKNNSDFDSLAGQFSDDAKSAAIGGDLGFVSYKDIVPEIYNAAAATTDHGVHIMNSRFGIHLYKVVSVDSKGPHSSQRYHIKQIFIKTLDFDKWLDSQKNSYNAVKFVW